MFKCLHVVCLLLANFHPSLSDKDNSKEEGRDQKDSVTNRTEVGNVSLECQRPSELDICSPSKEVIIGANVTLECFSREGSLPINYTLYKQKKTVYTITKTKREKAVFHFTIKELSQYKCKAVNQCNDFKYSPAFNFTLRAELSHSSVLHIVFSVMLLIVLPVAISLLILWCKARKRKSTKLTASSAPTTSPTSENDTTYDEIALEDRDQVEYAKVRFNANNQEDFRNVTFEEDTTEDATVNYAEIVTRR